MKRVIGLIMSLIFMANMCPGRIIAVLAAETDIIIAAQADAQVQGGTASGRNYGASTSIQVRDDGYRKGIFRFDVSQAAENMSKAVFRVYCNTSAKWEFPLVVGLADNDDWIEGEKKGTQASAGELTYDNFPQMADSFEYPFIPSKGYMEIDVTEYVKSKPADGTVSIILSGGNTASADRNPAFFSRESSNPPQLVITSEYESVAESVIISGKNKIITAKSGDTAEKYTAQILDNAGNIFESEPVWRVFEKDTQRELDGISIENGELRIGEIEREFDVDIYAYCADNEDIFDKISVKVIPGSLLKDITILSDGDTFVQGGSLANNNFGAASRLQIRDDNYRMAFVRFNISKIVGDIKNASLRLYCNTELDKEFPFAAGIADRDDWVEGTKNQAAAEEDEMCRNNMPGYEEKTEFPFKPTKGYIEIDVTELVNSKLSDGMITFSLSGYKTIDSAQNLYFNSREESNGVPELVVQTVYDAVPSGMSIDGAEQIITSGTSEKVSAEYTAVVYDQANQEITDEAVDWKVYEAGTQKQPEGITVKNGILTAGKIDSSIDVDIIASCVSDSSIYAVKTVHILNGSDYATKNISVMAEADAQLQGGSKRNTNYGASKTLQIRNDGYRRAIFRFDLSGVFGIVESAELNLYKTTTTSEDLSFKLMLADNDDWQEGDKADGGAEGDEICEANAPAYTDRMEVILAQNIGYTAFDVKPFVAKKLEENKKATVYISGDNVNGTTNVSFSSKEAGTNPPRLNLVMKYIPKISHVDINGAASVIVPYAGTATQMYTAAVTDQYFEPIQGQTYWSLKEELSGVSIDQNGRLSVSNYAESGRAVIEVRSGDVTGEFAVDLKTAQEAVDAAYDALDIGNTDYVTSNLVLPTQGAYGVNIEWQSDDESIIANNGEINRPDTEQQYVSVNLCAKLSMDGTEREKTFTVNVVQKEKIIEIEAEHKGFIHNGGAARERLINPYRTWITSNGGRKVVLSFDISKLRKYKDRIEKAEVMMVPWFQQANANKVELINSAVISDDWDPLVLGEDGKYDIDGINYIDKIKTLKSNVAQGYYTVHEERRYVAVDMTEQIKQKIENYPENELTTVNSGNYSGSKFSVMLYADNPEFTSTQQYMYPLLKVTLAYSGAPSDIKIEQDIYYDDKVRVPSEGTEIRRYVASAVDEMDRKYPKVNDFEFGLASEYEGVSISPDGELSVGTAAKAGNITVICRCESAGLEKSFDVELLEPIAKVERPNLLFDKKSIVQVRQKVNSDSALMSKYKTMRAVASGVNINDITTLEQIRDTASPWVNEMSYSFTAPAEAVKFEFGFKAWGQGSWEFDNTSIMWIGKSSIEYDNRDFEDGSGNNPNGWRREVISGTPELRWDHKTDHQVKSGQRAIGISGSSSDSCGAWVSSPIDCSGGSQYLVYTAYNQPEISPDGAAVIFMRFIDKNGNYLDDYYQESGELNYRTISRRNGLPYEDLMAAYAMEGNVNFAYATKQYLMYILYEMKCRIENNDDSTQAVHLGRMIQGCALAYDLLKGYDMLSDEEDRQMRSYFYWLTDMLMNPDFYPLDNAHDRSHNFNADRTSGVLSVAACFPEWSKSEEYINHCIGEIYFIFGGGGTSFGTRGEWLETIRYQDAVANQLFGSFEILRRMRGINMFEDENIKKFCKYPVLVQTPRDAANASYPNFAGSPQIGNSLFNEGNMVLGRAAAVYRDIDPELSAELAYAWNRAGSALSAYHNLVLLTSFNSDLPEKKLSLGSDYFSNGYITFRENYGIDGKENYFVLVGKDTGYGSHQDPDRGSFSMWARNTCIAQDPGVANYDGNSAWFRDSGAHNMVTFYETDTSDVTINGVDTTVDDVYMSEELDYARINADDTKDTYDYTRHVAFIKNGFSAYVFWDNIENSSRRSRYNLHTISTKTDIDNNKLTSSCYNDMVLDTVVLNDSNPDIKLEWGRMTGGYPKVMTDFSKEPVEAAQHIKITNPKNKDFITLLYPRKSKESGLFTETIASDENGISGYKIGKNEREYFIVLMNNSTEEKSISLEEGLRSARSGEIYGKNITVMGEDMMVLFPDTIAKPEPTAVEIDGSASIDVPTDGVEKGYFVANVFDNYENTMPARKVEWTLSGADEGITVDDNGTVSVTNKAETGKTVTLSAKVTGTDISGSKSFVLRDNTELAQMEIIGSKNILPGSSAGYSVKFMDKYGRELSGYREIWSLYNPVDGVTLSAGGGISVASSVPVGTTIELIASYAADMTINARVLITVGAAQLAAVEISGANAVSVPGTAKYSTAGKDENGKDFDISNAEIEYSLAEETEGVSISADGILTVAENAPRGTSFTVVVTVNGTLTAQKNVLLREYMPSKIEIFGKTSLNVPSSGIVEESYRAVVYDQNGNEMKDETAVISMGNAQGVNFKNNVLSVTQYASAQEITLTAVCEGLTAGMNVRIVRANTSNDAGGSSSGGGSGSGGYVNSGAVPSGNKPEAKGFADLSGYEWAADAIEYLRDNGMVSGMTDTEFAPGRNVTRAEFTAMIVKALGIEVKDNVQPYEDVAPDDWYYTAVSSGRAFGIVEGIDDTHFEPSRNITRQEMAAIVYRALDKLGKTGADGINASLFDDDTDISDWASDAVKYMRGAGIISGMEDNRFMPFENATRAQAAVVMYKLVTNGSDELYERN